MIFDLIPNLFSSLISIVLPIHFTHKALRTSSPPFLAPWLMYWSILSLFLLFESYLPLLSWLPLYSTARLFFLTWMVLPQTQGATYLYQNYVEPFLVEYEGRIDNAISDAHRKIKAAGGDLFVRVVEKAQSMITGREPVKEPAPAVGENYAQNLLRRFSIPVAGFPAPTAQGNDLSGLLTSFTSTLGLNLAGHQYSARDAQISTLTKSNTLIPPTLKSVNDRVDFVRKQREQLKVLLGALDKEALDLDGQRDLERRVGAGAGGLNKSTSEIFEVVDRPGTDGAADSSGKNKAGKGSWLGGWWAANEEKASHGSVNVPEGKPREEVKRGLSSGIDL